MRLELGIMRMVAVLTALSLTPLVSAQSSPISIKVLEGNAAINNISRKSAYAPVVQVVDAADQPVARAAVTFTVPSIGPGGRFTDGGTTLTVMTDEEGKAAGRGLTPNSTPGQFEIRVNASFGGRTARAVITQTNAAPVRAQSGNTRKLLVIGLIAGAAAGGLFAAQSGGGNTPATARPPASSDPPSSGTITPGTPGFGPPQ
jgi:hypothetical protein